ncbi:hypothetical protein [Paraglaciecola sp. L1A13]|uniref:hypothetical protein n=1 Tax=Paraglaciecola sp. L1A13 TaxID=2686359 RepID=UPI001E4AEC7B|nr:hypothetical protein [Paraglaciecola sp. L1A13]
MARHPDVQEKDIIQAGRELEDMGKKPNPGAIRAQLGYHGGLMRIKSIWEAFVKKESKSFYLSKAQSSALKPCRTIMPVMRLCLWKGFPVQSSS